MSSTLSDWLTYLESLHPKPIALGLERVAAVKQRLNLNPAFPIITVGGTNGKGSVCAMLEAMLHAAGYKVGCYTSPHLLRYNERVRISNQEVSDEQLCASFERVEEARTGQQLDSRLRGNDEPSAIPLTYFEFGTLSAMQIFVEQKVDVAILEVGLGGRLDAVNIFDSDVAVVSSVDMDHMDYLGDSIGKIAYEKAGIFRRGKVAIFGDASMPEVVASEAKRIGAELWRLGGEFSFSASPLSLTLSPQGARELGQWNYCGPGGGRNSLPYPALRGSYQLNNASTALAALDALKEKLPVSMEAVRRGLLELTLPARFQLLPGQPQLILDVAHNPHAACGLANSLATLPFSPKTYAVCAMLRDKDIAGVISALKSQVDVWFIASLDVPRGASADELARVFEQLQVREVLHFASVADALHEACNRAGENDRILAFGSFYTVADVMRARGLRSA